MTVPSLSQFIILTSLSLLDRVSIHMLHNQLNPSVSLVNRSREIPRYVNDNLYLVIIQLRGAEKIV